MNYISILGKAVDHTGSIKLTQQEFNAWKSSGVAENCTVAEVAMLSGASIRRRNWWAEFLRTPDRNEVVSQL